MLNVRMIVGTPKKLFQLISMSMAGSRVYNQYKPAFSTINVVRQGDALYSILFYIVLEAIFQNMNITGYVGTKSTQIFACADDVAIASRNKNALKVP